MKKTIKSLALLAVVTLAVTFTSCKKADLEQALSNDGNVVTIKIAPPSVDTKVTVTDDNGSSPIIVTGWTDGDVVDLYKLGTSDNVYTKVEFTCTDAASGTFTGTLPSGVKLEDLTHAIYNATVDFYAYSETLEDCYLRIFPKVRASTSVRDIIVMTAVNSGSGFRMKVVNNIVKVRNTTLNDIEAAWKTRKLFDILHPEYSYVKDMACRVNVSSGAVTYHQLPTCDITSDNFDKCKFTLRSKKDYYLSLCPGGDVPYIIGLSAKRDAAGTVSLIGVKMISQISSTGGKIYSAPAILPNGALRGEFSISSLPQRKVHFAKGNLYYTGSSWALEANQYDYRTWAGNDACIAGTITDNGTPSGNVGTFYWTSAAAKSYVETYSETGTGSGDTFFADTDASVIGSIWRALTREEWIYLLKSRTDAENKIGFATVCGVTGVILLPDTFTDPEKNGGSGAFVPRSTTGFSANTYTEDDWYAMEAAGAVFLPAAGYRDHHIISMVGFQSYYWTATAHDDDDSYSVWICGSDVNIDGEIEQRDNGFPIRLVTGAE